MKKKVLFVATVDSHIRFFHLPYLQYFKERGYEVHVATNGDEEFPYCDVKHRVPMDKSPINLVNIKGYRGLKEIINKERFEIIHCNMPMAAVLTRLAARRSRKRGTKVIYTAHGFHFYKGAPLKNWILYYPVEKWCSRYTDCLITINKEDYALAKRKFKAKRVEWIKGVGIDVKKFDIHTVDEKEKFRREYGFSNKDFILMYVAEVSKRKNQMLLIEAIDRLKHFIPEVKLVLVGTDSLNGECQKLVEEKGLIDEVRFLGERQDVDKLLALPNLYISTSTQEGLPINILEAMASGLTVCATSIRGHVDIIRHMQNGYLFKKIEVNEIVDMIKKVYIDTQKYMLNEDKVRNSILDYEQSKILASMREVYADLKE